MATRSPCTPLSRQTTEHVLAYLANLSEAPVTLEQLRERLGRRLPAALATAVARATRGTATALRDTTA